VKHPDEQSLIRDCMIHVRIEPPGAEMQFNNTVYTTFSKTF